MIGPDRQLAQQRTRALAELSELRTMLGRLPEDDRGYDELAVRKRVAAAEALNLGVPDQTVRTVGMLDDLEFQRAQREAADFRDYDAELYEDG
ncbi:hypothetical protein [Nocardia sp. BMG51109]|uniref:hypothetical protein n=1 Tax=Nocardia sp. BMG51109 TaxID=1056816 RepID=UPI000465E7E4|nr:hypothetical protein [Nocardia sp. BMG51109]